MRKADIVINQAYYAEVDYRQFLKVTVLETGVSHDPGFGRNRRRQDGVRVRLEEAYTTPGYRQEEHPIGEEQTVTSRKVLRPWTAEDDAGRARGESEKARKDEIERRLGEAGYAEDGYDRTSHQFVDGDYCWRGEDLQLSPKLTADCSNRPGSERSERSMKLRDRGSPGRRNRWPLNLDTRDPEGVADFTLGLGYTEEQVVTALVKRCSLDRQTAQRIVENVARNQVGGLNGN